jgi:hypothetical protein
MMGYGLLNRGVCILCVYRFTSEMMGNITTLGQADSHSQASIELTLSLHKRKADHKMRECYTRKLRNAQQREVYDINSPPNASPYKHTLSTRSNPVQHSAAAGSVVPAYANRSLVPHQKH